jgi:hypothetical protein
VRDGEGRTAELGDSGSSAFRSTTDLRSTVRTQAPAFLINFGHDELVLEVRDDLVDEVSSLLVDEMTGAFLELFQLYEPELVARGLVGN